MSDQSSDSEATNSRRSCKWILIAIIITREMYNIVGQATVVYVAPHLTGCTAYSAKSSISSIYLGIMKLGQLVDRPYLAT